MINFLLFIFLGVCLEIISSRAAGGDGLKIHTPHQFYKHLDSMRFKATLYWMRVFYSLSALRFTIYNLPVLSSILTHTVPTGFNRRGTVVAFILQPFVDPDRKEEELLASQERLEQGEMSIEETEENSGA